MTEQTIWSAFIGGGWVDAGDRETFAVLEPATGREIGRVVNGDEQLVAEAVADSRRAFARVARAGAPRARPAAAAGRRPDPRAP